VVFNVFVKTLWKLTRILRIKEKNNLKRGGGAKRKLKRSEGYNNNQQN